MANEEEIRIEMFKTFCRLHPIEAYDLDAMMFCEFMREEGYSLTNKEIENLINESR